MVIESAESQIVRALSLQGFATQEYGGGVRMVATYKATQIELSLGRDGCLTVSGRR